MAGKLRSEELRVVRSEDDVPQAKPAQRSIAVEVSGATLHYPIGPVARGSLKSSIFGLFGHKDRTPAPVFVEAVRDINLKVSFGERVALIGQNGSGKSTMLRALAGIYPLKKGTIRVIGQIGTLLDVALGFESESTGRENIYYRGMAMGYSRRKLKAAEQAIVDFAALGDFIDMPMRTYSTGMYIRLGFAVSTHFSPEILLIDEVFAAGDASFSQRAIERMTHIVREAGIMVIASHDLDMVQRVCNRVVWLNRGEIALDGPPHVVIPQYLKHSSGG
jgi:lipopolysaccharide transport system ATP-binding protein